MEVYKAPLAQVAVPQDIKSQPVKGVIFGALLDVVLSTVLFVGFALATGAYMASHGASEQQILQFMQAIEQDNVSVAASMLIGGGCSALGGFVCARYAREHELRYGCILAAILTVLSVAFETDMGMLALSIGVTWVAVLAGCGWGQRRNRSEVLQ